MPERSITEIGKYKIVGLVGEGAMGVVYRATDSVLGRTVAVKVMSESIARQQDLRDRFLREAQAAGTMQHPNINSIYDLGEIEGHLYIVMEFVEGVDLATLISTRKPLTLQTKIDIIVDVLAGLAYAHKRGIVHRDVKPANIRIAEDGRAKIMDFGVAYLTSSTLTQTGAAIGTPAYMAPEQITGHKTTPATDLFATGAVLYELLTGVQAFAAPTVQSLFFKIVAEPPVPIHSLLPGLPAELGRIVNKSLEKNQSSRYTTALEMANDLTQLRATLSNPVQPATMSLTATVAHAVAERQRATKRTRELAAGGGVLALAAVAAIWFAVFRREQSPVAAQQVTKVSGESVVATPRNESANPPPPAAIIQSSAPDTKETVALQETKTQPKPSPANPPARTKKSNEPIVRRQVLPGPPVVARVVTPPPAAIPAASPAPQPAPPPAPSPIAATVTAPPPAAVAPAPPAPSAAGVRAVLQEYGHAIEQRDIGAMRRVYPELTSSEQAVWERFFQGARRIKVDIQVRSIEVNGSSAQARLAGTYDYENNEGQPQPTLRVSSASLKHDGSAWHIVSIR
jgi:serine/threonine protein kinase